MRRHFAGCLEDKLIRHFPAKKRNLRKATKRVEVMNVYCTCRMPEEDGERMISYDSCKQWFHEKCITVPEEAWTDNSYIMVLCHNMISFVLILIILVPGLVTDN